MTKTFIYLQLDILTELPGDTFDLIVSNPPYIKISEAEEMDENVVHHEPALALFAPAHDPIVFYRRMIALSQKHLNAGGELWFELNPLTAEEVKVLATESELFASVKLLQDMSGKTRFMVATRNH